MPSESARVESASDDDRSSPSSGSSDGGTSRNNLRRPSSRVALLLLGALLGGVAVWQLLSQPDADSNGESSAAANTQAAASPRTFAANGVSFTYPATLHHLEGDELDTLVQPPPLASYTAYTKGWREVFKLDENSYVIVSIVPLPFVVTSENVDEFVTSVGPSSGINAADVSVSALQGLPTLQFAGLGGQTPSGRLRHDMTLVFSGSTGYVIDCQSDARSRQRITAACTDIVESFKVAKRSSSAGWRVLASDDDTIQVSVPPTWTEESSHGRVELEATLQFPGSPGPNIVLWITLREELSGVSRKHATAYLVHRSRMQLIAERSVRLPAGMADMVLLKDGSRRAIGFVVIKDHIPVIVTFVFGDPDMRLIGPTIDAIAQTLAVD